MTSWAWYAQGRRAAKRVRATTQQLVRPGFGACAIGFQGPQVATSCLCRDMAEAGTS